MVDLEDTQPGGPPDPATKAAIAEAARRPPRPPVRAPAPSDAGYRWKILMRRALHSDLDPIEVLPDEVTPLEVDNAHNGSEPMRRLLLWRRAALLVAFLFQVPPLLVRFIKAIIAVGDNDRDVLASLEFLLVLLEIFVLFAILSAFRNWASWHRSKRVLFWTWVVSFVGPFLVALVPFRGLFDRQVGDAGAMIMGMAMGIVVFIQLAPKVLALLPGILRAAVIAKAAFPMSSLPGWLIQVAAPIDALLMYVVINLPYQMAGGGWMLPALILLTIAPIFFYNGGKLLAAPHSLEEALVLIKKTRRGAIIANVAGGVFLVIGLLVTIGAMEVGGKHLFSIADVFLPVFSLIAGIFLLEVIGIDVMLGAMVKLHEGRTERSDMTAAQSAYDAELTAFAAAVRADEARIKAAARS